MASHEVGFSSEPPAPYHSLICNENVNTAARSPSSSMGVAQISSRSNNYTAIYKETEHISCLTENLKALREASVLCDVEINLGNDKILAHKCVLAASSKKLKTLIYEDENQTHMQSIDLAATPSAFLNMINYLYTGCLSICLENIEELIALATELEISGVLKLCCKHLQDSVNVDNWPVIFRLATSLDLELATEAMELFARDNFPDLSRSNCLIDIDFQHFKAIISLCNSGNHSDLEAVKINEILKWINCNETRLSHFDDLLMLTNIQSVEQIAVLESCMSKIALNMFVTENQNYKRFIASLETEKCRPKTPFSVHSGNIENNITPVLITPKLNDTKENESYTNKESEPLIHDGRDKQDDSDATVEDYADFDDIDKEKTAVSNVQIQHTECEDGAELKNKRKSFRPKRLQTMKRLKLKSSGATHRGRGRPRKTTIADARPKKPKMKTSCTQVLAENIADEFEEIEREERAFGPDFAMCGEDDEGGLQKLEAIESIVKVEPKAPEEVSRKVTQIIQRLDKCSKRSRAKPLAKTTKPSPNVSPDKDYGAETDVDDDDTLLAMGEVRKKKRRYKTKKNENGEAEIFQCQRCPRQFYTPSKLKHHMKGHGAAAPMLCEHCGFSTIHFASMNIHRRIHDASLQYKCTWAGCDYTTIRSNRLQDHIAKHSGVKNHVCSTCGKAYAGRKHLNRHEQSHKEEKLVRCDECNYQSTRRDKLRDHIKKHHPGTAIVLGYMHPDDLNKPKPPPRKRPPRVRKPKRPKPPKDIDPEPIVNEVEGQLAVVDLQSVLVDTVQKDESVASEYMDNNTSNVLHIIEENKDHPQDLVTRDNTHASHQQQSTNRIPVTTPISPAQPLVHARGHQPTTLFQLPAQFLQGGVLSEEMLHLLQGTGAAGTHTALMMTGGQSGTVHNTGTVSVSSGAAGQVGVGGQNFVGPSGEQAWYVMNYQQ